MKRVESPKRPRKTQDEMRGEYRFDYAKARSNRFADRMKNGVVAVILDPDVAAVFGSSKEVNAFLRSVITTLPVRVHKRTKTG
jgi:tRNA(His) 5'-end guanylyltransferase